MKYVAAIAICLALMMCGFSKKDNPMPIQPDISVVRAKLAFTCVHEANRLPSQDAQVDTLFKYGLFLEKQDGPKDFDVAARYYRIAAAHGHYKANHNLQLLVSEGFARSPDAPNETIDLVEQLIAAGIPGGYYDMGHYLELGYGVKKDESKARVYFRKAADLGSPEAQAYVGKLLAPADKAPDVAMQMRQCATEQGNADAASDLGVHWQDSGSFAEAIGSFQAGVKAGDPLSTFALQNGFDADPSDAVYYLGQPKDNERSRRYGLIWKFIDDNDGLNPKVPDIDQIVPLPPAKLPPWDGTFQWEKEQDAAALPQKPDDKLVERLAREKSLDPMTGLRLAPAKSAKAERMPIGTTARPGEVCPQDGYWCVRPFDVYRPETIRRFSRGEILPLLVVDYPRHIPVLDALFGMRTHEIDKEWTLKSYADQV